MWQTEQQGQGLDTRGSPFICSISAHMDRCATVPGQHCNTRHGAPARGGDGPGRWSMGRIRQRTPVEIRERALDTAVAKFDAGCENCTASYLRLAQLNGATESQAQRAAMGRRGFLKLVGMVFAAGAAASAAGLIGPKVARAAFPALPNGSSGFFGVDSCTSLAVATGAGMPAEFYIAEVG